MSELTTRQKAEEAKQRAEALLAELDMLEQREREEQQSLIRAANFVNKEGAADIEKMDFLAFFKRPYALIPQGKNKVLVAVPKFVKGFQVGWLWKETETFYIYQFDQYSAWLGDAPADLLDAINFKTLIGSRAFAASGDVDGPSAANNRPWSRRCIARLLRRSDASTSAHGCGGTRSVRRAGAGSVG